MQRLDRDKAEKCIRCRKRGKRLQVGVHDAIEQHMAIGADKSAQENDYPANRQIAVSPMNRKPNSAAYLPVSAETTASSVAPIKVCVKP